jgi:hypothetical protein
MERHALAMQGPVSWLRKGASREAAESEAAKLFSLTEFQRRALLLQERL